MKRVLFIDVRNATRSQIAEAWFNHLAAHWGKASSCGTMPAERISGRAAQVLKEVGIDIQGRSPKPITQRLLNQADIVILIGTGIFPHALAPTQIWNLEDPNGKSLEEVRFLRDQMRVHVETLIEELRREEAIAADWQTCPPVYGMCQ